jgi:hypothetical protein
MARNKIYAIVEGHGEAEAPTEGEQPAVTVLIAKLLQDLQCWTLFPAKKPPWRMRSSGDFFAANKLENVIRAHTRFPDCAALLVLLDMDDECPKEQGPALAERIRTIEALPFTVVIVCATREYEAWFLASLESIHPSHTYKGEPEAIRAAKGWLKRQFDYREARDQSAYTRALDVVLAWDRSRSFKRLYHAFEQIVAAVETNQAIVTP